MSYVTLSEAAQIVHNETGVDITVTQLIRVGFLQNLPLCVLLDVECYSPTHKIRRETKAQELDPEYWGSGQMDRTNDADVVYAYGLFVLPPRHVFAYQTNETVRVNSVESLNRQDIYYPGVDVSRDALQITIPHLHAFISHIKATQAAQQTAPAQNTATPAPVADSTSTTQDVTMKKAALIAQLEYEWASIEADLSDATRNGLKAAAHAGKHGEWYKDRARAWAVSKGKIKQDAPVHSLAAAWSGAVTRNTIGH